MNSHYPRLVCQKHLNEISHQNNKDPNPLIQIELSSIPKHLQGTCSYCLDESTGDNRRAVMVLDRIKI